MEPDLEARCWLALGQGGDEDGETEEDVVEAIVAARGGEERPTQADRAAVGGLLLGDIRRALRRG